MHKKNLGGNSPKPKTSHDGIPPSLSDVAGTGGHSDFAGYSTTVNPPDWDEWCHIPTMHLREACALSMNIDPHQLRENRTCGWEPPVYDKGLRDKFSKRLRIATANYDADKFKAVGFIEHVWLSDFANWAVNVVQWHDMPQEFVLLASPSSSAPAESKPESSTVTEKFQSGTTTEDWKSKSRKIADRIGRERWDNGIREITCRNICEAVAKELADDTTTHGTRGPRSSNYVRTEGLKEWKFRPPEK